MTEPVPPTPDEVCPGPPEARYPVSDTYAWTHRWTPVAALPEPGDERFELAGKARVVEVCPTCRQWRTFGYARWTPTPGVSG